jgi:hypothetical protein
MLQRSRNPLIKGVLGAAVFALLSFVAVASASNSDTLLRLTPFPTLDRTVMPESTKARDVGSATSTPEALASLQPIRLTEGGCCPNPEWSQDSEWVLFFDRPTEEEEAGLYGVPADGGGVTEIHDRIGVYAKSHSVVAYRSGGFTVIERWADGDKWYVQNDARTVHFSPSANMVAWIVTSHGISFPDVRQRAIWVATRAQPEGREIVTVNGGSLLGWTQNEKAVLVTGRLAPDGPAGVWKITLQDGAGRLLVEVDNIHSPLMSPSGEWVAFMSTFNNDPELDGLWVVDTKAGVSKKLSFFGAYRWRREGTLLVIPMDLAPEGVSLWQVDVSTLALDKLTDANITQLPIANNDWEPSPDGEKMVFLSSKDHNLWVLNLPEP